ncbi:MAG: hypothetical protein RR420_08635, partial [Anaerovoracaceae bacterium]
ILRISVGHWLEKCCWAVNPIKTPSGLIKFSEQIKPNGQIKHARHKNAQRAAITNLAGYPIGQPKTGSALFQVSQTKTGSAHLQAQAGNLAPIIFIGAEGKDTKLEAKKFTKTKILYKTEGN